MPFEICESEDYSRLGKRADQQRRFTIKIDGKEWRGKGWRGTHGSIRRYMTAENALRAYLKYSKQKLLGQK